MPVIVAVTGEPIKPDVASPTNRANATPLSGVPPVFTGIDTLRLRGRYRSHGLANRNTLERLVRSTGELVFRHASGHEVLPTSGVAVMADDRYGKHISFEMSVPRLLTGSNVVAASPRDALQAVRLVHQEASEFVDWLDDWNELQLRRGDYVRDVRGVTDIPGVLDRLALIPAASGQIRRRYNDPRLGHAESLTVGTKHRWLITAYDKAAEQTAAARRAREPHQKQFHLKQASRAQGQLRVEVSVRADPLHERYGTNSLLDLIKEDVINETAQHYFDAARFGAPVGGASKVSAALTAMSKHRKHAKMTDRLLGMLMLASLDLPQTASHNCVDRYMQVARLYGLTPADFHQTDRATIRLDWETGSVVEVAA